MIDEQLQKEPVWAVINLLQVAAWLREELNQTLTTESDLTLPEQEAMVRLLHHGPLVPMSELAELVLFSQSGITRLIDRLERKGMVRREFSKEDRRVTFATLTDEGRERLLAVANPAVARFAAERLSGHLSVEDVSAMRRMLLDLIHGNGWWDERRHRPEPPLELRSTTPTD